ncbi:MAG: Gfo/Idh/MocA family oxidoreductase, partial [Anaerolineae bacterium]|nr:Gfo/Idh/MocA family oxidoreductase [Anaerolineae bacterium]
MADKLRVGILGCGGTTLGHVQAYQYLGERCEVVALADLHEEAMARFDRERGISPHHYLDAREMLDKEALDVVSIGTWQSGHGMWTVAAAARRPKAIVVEKPMAASLQDAEQMLVACRRNNVKFIVGHQRRFLPAYNLARELITAGAVGQVELVECLGADGFPNQFSHQADMLRYVLGDVDCEWVMGNVERKTDRWERGTRIEDRGVGVFQFKNGTRAVSLCDMIPALGGVEVQGGRFTGSEGLIQLGTEHLRLLNKETGGVWKEYHPDGRFFKLAEEGRAFEWREGYTHQMAELFDWIDGIVPTHRGSAENGYKALEMVLAIYESARCHERVMLPLQTRLNPLDVMVESGDLAPTRPGRYDVRARMLRGELMYDDG